MSDRSSNSQNLPRIRDILGDQLSSSTSGHGWHRSTSGHSAPEGRYPGGATSRTHAHAPFPATVSPQHPANWHSSGGAIPRQSPSLSYAQPPTPSRFGAASPGPGSPHYPGSSTRYPSTSVPTLRSDVNWQSSSQTARASSSAQSYPSPQMHRPSGLGPQSSQTTGSYQSPQGGLVADMRAPGSTPQHSSPYLQGSFPVIPEDQQPNARYSCSHCGKRFSRPSSLRTHEHSHTGVKPFACSYPNCGRRFSVQSNMRRHMAKVHERGGSSKQGESSEDEYDDESEICARH